jgi:hypothetical protein
MVFPGNPPILYPDPHWKFSAVLAPFFNKQESRVDHGRFCKTCLANETERCEACPGVWSILAPGTDYVIVDTRDVKRMALAPLSGSQSTRRWRTATKLCFNVLAVLSYCKACGDLIDRDGMNNNGYE